MTPHSGRQQGQKHRADVPVVIVGAGPTGTTAATLLARYGVRSVVLERWEQVYPQPRAVHLDDEICRILGQLGVHAEFAAVSRPGLGLRLVERDLRVLAEFSRSHGLGPHGYPQANMFDQPDLEALLRRNLNGFDEVELRTGVEVTSVVREAAGIMRVEWTDRESDLRSHTRARYVLGCDGANSKVRTGIGSRMLDLGFEQNWLVVDIETKADLGVWDGVQQLCDTERAATCMRVGFTRYRWEFQLPGQESAADYPDLEALEPLLAPWLNGVPLTELGLVRVADYTFRAQLADRWRRGRVFLLGDAAHLTPPFIGQGLGAGLRDAANLAWKLAAVTQGSLPEAALDSYETERRPHANSMIRLAKLIGAAMTGGGRVAEVARRLVAPHLHRLPGVSDLATRSETPALSRSSLVSRSGRGGSMTGRLCPNLLLDNGRRVDAALAGRFGVVTALVPTELQWREVERRGGTVVVATQGSLLQHWLRRRGVETAVVRPDRTVMAAGSDLAELCRSVPRLHLASAYSPSAANG